MKGLGFIIIVIVILVLMSMMREGIDEVKEHPFETNMQSAKVIYDEGKNLYTVIKDSRTEDET